MSLTPLTIVSTNAGTGVVLSKTQDVPYDEYRVQMIEIVEDEDYGEGHLLYRAGFVGLFNADQICQIGFCENDSEQGVILCAAAGYEMHSGRRRSYGFDSHVQVVHGKED